MQRNHTRGQWQAMQSHAFGLLTVPSSEGVTYSVEEIIMTLPFNHTSVLCVYVFAFGHVLLDHGSVSAAVTHRSSNYLIVEATSFFDLWSGIGS